MQPGLEQGGLFGEAVVQPASGRMTLSMLETWLHEEAPPTWLEGYLFLRAKGVRYRDAMLATWLSLGTDDRGAVPTRQDFARLMGVARATTYDWESRRPEIRQWAELLQVMRLRGARLAEVDEAAYHAAVAADGTASDRKLYYQRAGVWEEEQRVHLMGESDGPVQVEEVTDGELDAIREALIEATSGGSTG